MKRIHLPIGALGLIGCLSLATCDRSGSTPLNNLLSGTSGPSSNGSVGDVTANGGGADTTPGQTVPPIEAVRARVRNESSARADVTVRFIREDTVVHLAFVRVLPKTITTAASPEAADTVELSGLDDRGRALSDATFVFGVDFNAASPAEYTVMDEGAVTPPPSPIPPTQPPVGHPTPPRLTMVEPSHDLSVSLGSTFAASWDDSAGSGAAVVSLFLQPVAASGAHELHAVGPGISATLDGINDQLDVLVQNVDPGVYRLVGRIDDGSLSATSTARGSIRVARDPTDAAPTLKIRSPGGVVELRNGDSLTVQWDDADPDDNATITFTLVSAVATDAAVESFGIGPPIAENPDGPAADSATLVLHDVLPGWYDLWGTIDDGRLIGTDRVGRAVHVLPPADNDPPQMVLSEPATDVDVEVGRSLFVRWTDSDANDDARISLLLDPDVGNVPLNGNEILLVASLGEDADGAGDQITLGIPPGVAEGTYRLVGVISDGLTQMLVTAPGRVHVHQATSNDNANDNTNDNANENENDNGNDNGGGGGVVIIVLPPPPPPAPSPWTVTPIDLPGAVTIQPGEVVTVQLEGTVSPPDSSRRVYLSNRRYGGAVRVEVGPAQLQQIDVKTVVVPLRANAIPNDAWPRNFDVELETVVDGAVHLEVGSRPVWIVQAVEVTGIALIGSACVPAAGTGSATVPLEITWYGGGLVEEGSNPAVQFWLSKDGGVPGGGANDAAHRLVLETAGSPHVVRTVRVDVGASSPPVNIAGDVGALTPSDVVPTTALEVGEYRLVTVFDPEGVNRTVSDPFSTPIAVCDPSRSPDSGKRP